MKRLVDLVIGCVILIVLAIPMLLVAILVLITSKEAVLY